MFEEERMNDLEVQAALAHQLLPSDRLVKMSVYPNAQVLEGLFLICGVGGPLNL